MVKILMVINEYWHIDIPDLAIKTNAWMHLLGEYGYQDTLKAVDEYMLTAEHKEYAPNQGQLIEIMQKKPEPMINAQAYRIEQRKEVPGACPMPAHAKARIDAMAKGWGIDDYD